MNITMDSNTLGAIIAVCAFACIAMIFWCASR